MAGWPEVERNRPVRWQDYLEPGGVISPLSGTCRLHHSVSLQARFMGANGHQTPPPPATSPQDQKCLSEISMSPATFPARDNHTTPIPIARSDTGPRAPDSPIHPRVVTGSQRFTRRFLGCRTTDDNQLSKTASFWETASRGVTKVHNCCRQMG